MVTRIVKPVKRETEMLHNGRLLIVTLYPRSMELHEQGKQDGVLLPYDAIYNFGRKIKANAKS